MPPLFFLSEVVYVVRTVAYVKYERASSAAAAMESLHEAILEDGRTKLKVLLAEEPHATCASAAALAYCQSVVPAFEPSSDPYTPIE